MQNVKKVNSISNVLEEIVKCVTAPSFCVMPWKCVTMAVGDRTDPLVKKSVVHIYRTCVNGQNIFQIKVHNCKKEQCDHAICTKDCENRQETNNQAGKEANQNEINKRKRKKRNKTFDEHKETAVGYSVGDTANIEEHGSKSILKERKDIKHNNTSVQKNKRPTKKTGNIEKPSCTLQIFADGRSRKLNFQLHPAMKVFLGKALDRIEGHDSKRPIPTSPTNTNTSHSRLDASIDEDCKPKMEKSPLKTTHCRSKNKRTESVEEFEINLPDNTCHEKDYTDHLSQISGRSCHCEEHPVSGHVKDGVFISKQKTNVGYLLDDIIPAQKSDNGKGNFDKEVHGVKTESPLGRTLENCNNEQLMTDDTHQRTTAKTVVEPHRERERERIDQTDGMQMRDEEIFHPPNLQNHTFQAHQVDHCTSTYDNDGTKSKIKKTPTDSVRNISCGTENGHQSYINSSQCYENRIKQKLTRTPYIVDYHSDNNELLINDLRNINNRNYFIPDNRAPMHSSDLNYPSIYRSNTKIYTPPIVKKTFSMLPEYGTFLTKDDVYSNRFYGTRAYHNFPDDGMDFINMRVAPAHQNETYNRHLFQFPKGHRQTPIFNDECENRKECGIFNPLHFSNARDIDVYPDSERGMFFRKNNIHQSRQYLEDEPTSDRSHNIINNRISKVNYSEELMDNYLDEKCAYDRQRYSHAEDGGKVAELRRRHRSNKTIKRKDEKESGKSIPNSDNWNPWNSTKSQYCNMLNHTTIDSNASSNKENIASIENASESTGRKENIPFKGEINKNQKEKCNSSNKMYQSGDPSSHANYKLLNKSRTICENEGRHFFRQENFKTFKHIKPSKISSGEDVSNRLIRNNKKANTGNCNILKTSTVHRRKSSTENRINIKRTRSTDSTCSSNYFPQDIYVNDASEKSSDTSSCHYNFSKGYSNYQFFKPHRQVSGKKKISREIVNDTNETLCDDEYDSDSNFFCYPSQISWKHYENLHQIIPNINHEHYLKVKDKRSEKNVEPKIHIATEGESSKLCHACCKRLNEDKSGIKSSSSSDANKHNTRNSYTKHFIMNSSQHKNTSREPFQSNNDLTSNKGKHSCNSKRIDSNGVGKSTDYSLTNSVNDKNRDCRNHRFEKSNVVERNDLKEQNGTTKCESLEKKQSKMLHSQSVKKFFNHAKEYLNFRKYSTSSIRSGLSNGALNNGHQKDIGAGGAVKDIGDHPCVHRKHSEVASGIKQNNDFGNISKNLCSIPVSCLKNGTDGSKFSNKQGRLSDSLKATEALKNNIALACNYPETSKPVTYSFSQTNLKDEKYRLYGSNAITTDQMSAECTNPKFIKNEFKLLETESECEGFSDDMYCYSSSEWQSEVAKTWVASTKKKNIKRDKRVMVSLKKNKSKSFHSFKSELSNCKIEKEETCTSNNNKPMINATIALSPDKQKLKEIKVGIQDKFQVSPHQKQKNNHKFSNIFSNSIKSNYKKIKGLVRINHAYQKKKSPTRVPIFKFPSKTETRSISCLTPITSTYIATKSEDTSVVEKSTVERFCNESFTNNRTSDSNFVISEPIIRKIEPGTWQRFVSKKHAVKSTEISGTENIEAENSSLSDVSIDESGLQVRSNHRLVQPFGRTPNSKGTTTPSRNHLSASGPTLQRRPTYIQANRQAPETVEESNQSDESLIDISNNCFENPLVDPKTGFRPLLPA